jgi:hypothetical protein
MTSSCRRIRVEKTFELAANHSKHFLYNNIKFRGNIEYGIKKSHRRLERPNASEEIGGEESKGFFGWYLDVANFIINQG